MELVVCSFCRKLTWAHPVYSLCGCGGKWEVVVAVPYWFYRIIKGGNR